MPDTRPYQLGDVVDGHRWTVVGWERIDPPAAPEPPTVETSAVHGNADARSDEPAAAWEREPEPEAEPVGLADLFARTVVVAPDLVIELDDDDLADADVHADQAPAQAPEPDPASSPVAAAAYAGTPVDDDAAVPEPREPGADEPATTPLGAADPWRGFDWNALQAPDADAEPTPAPATDDDAFAAALALGAQALARRESAPEDPVDSPVVNGHRWTSAGWEPIDEWTGSQPEPAPVIVLPSEPPVEAVVVEQRQAPVFHVEPFVTYTEAPAAGWYPGTTPS